ncbi:hypothetical protein [Leyella stercorea]|uniref:hypothetical protein n=1 Tax=Leyella stercorea TaxID=363265 RepID=UPI00243004C0|nr:hypothetical protein [Leyella stercorea]
MRDDRRRHTHRPTQTYATTDADIRNDRRRHLQRPAQMVRSKITSSLERPKEA